MRWWRIRKTMSLLLLLLAAAAVTSSAEDGECQLHRAEQRLTVPARVKNLPIVELHIRHNIKGTVTFQDGASDSKDIVLDVEKVATSLDVLENIKTNISEIIGHTGPVYFLQMELQQQTSTLVPVVAGILTALLVLTVVVVLLTWWCCKKDTGHFVPMRAQAGRGGRVMVRSRAAGQAIHYDEGTPLNRGTPMPPPPPVVQQQDKAFNKKHTVVTTGRRAPGGALPGRTTAVTLTLLSVFTLLGVVYAACRKQPEVHIVISLPSTHTIDAFRLYFNRHLHNDVFITKWKNRSKAKVSIYDLDSALPTPNPPCQAEELCPQAYAQGLAGCEPHSKACICERGYQLRDNSCVDIDECSVDAHACSEGAFCRNTIGAWTCSCGDGFYGDNTNCAACKNGCPPGQYQTHPCSQGADASCAACEECTGPFYEVSPCTNSRDRKCMHVAHPLLLTDGSVHPAFMEGLKVEHSANVHLENLHSTKNLETTYYLMDNTQITDFFWIRESGLRVNIGVVNVNLIPEYEDVEHEGDNKFMLDPENRGDVNSFKRIVKHHCRNPVPDYYSITLEVSRDRTTAAHPVVCNSRDKGRLRCPDEFADGDLYVNRTLNEPCQPMGTFPEPVTGFHTNSIVCSRGTRMLGAIFNRTHAPERHIAFPPRDCISAQTRCSQCFNGRGCRMNDLFDQKCCEIDCYNLKECKHANSRHCHSAPVQCAMGDAYRYTIVPVYQQLQTSFKCHLKYRKPSHLYRLHFYISFPGTTFETKRFYRTVNTRDMAYQSRGSFTADFITVEHNAGLKLKEEFMMHGQSSEHAINYTLYSLKRPQDFSNDSIPVHEMTQNHFVAQMQFTEPFSYSTAKWIKGHNCNKDATRFKRVQPLHFDDAQRVFALPGQREEDDGFVYHMKSVRDPPYIRFLVPGNVSILSWYFRDGPFITSAADLTANLTIQPGGRVWKIYLNGVLSSCPGYVAVTVNDRLELEELFKYDVLVTCPRVFNLSFNVPNWGHKRHKTFDIRVSDAKQTYSLYLTHVEVLAGAAADRGILVKSVTSRGRPENPLAAVTVIILVTLMLMLLVLLFYVYTRCTKATFGPAQEDRLYHVIKDPHNMNGTSGKRYHNTSPLCFSTQNLSKSQQVFILAYVVAKLAYSVLFTFTMFSALLFLLLEGPGKAVTDTGKLRDRKWTESLNISKKIESQARRELIHQAEVVTNMQTSCNNYIDDVFRQLYKHFDNVSNNDAMQNIYGAKSSVSYHYQQRLERTMQKYKNTMNKHAERFAIRRKRELKPVMVKYDRYLKQIYDTQYLLFAQKLFNRSDIAIRRPYKLLKKSGFAGKEANFCHFLEIEETEKIQLWTEQFHQKYASLQPFMPNILHPKPAVCSNGHSAVDASSFATPSRLSSTRYFPQHLPGSPDTGFSTAAHTYEFVTSSEDVYHVHLDGDFPGDILANVNFGVVKLIFILMDVLLLLYRCSHLYLTVRSLCTQGFTSSVTLRGQNGGEASYTLHEHKQAVANAMHRSNGQQQGERRANGSIPQVEATAPARALESSVAARRVRRGVCAQLRAGLAHLFQHRAVVPCAVFICVFLVFFSLLAQLTVCNVNADALVSLRGVQVLLAGFSLHVEQTNDYLRAQAAHLNNALLRRFQRHANTELLHVSAIVQYFNNEQSRHVRNYASEVCAMRADLPTPCDVTVAPSTVQLTMLPCNFVPVQPRAFSGFNASNHADRLRLDLESQMAALRSIVLFTGYALLVLLCLVLLIHASGYALFYFLRTRHKFPVRKTFVTSQLLAATQEDLEDEGVMTSSLQGDSRVWDDRNRAAQAAKHGESFTETKV